jgi:hypothetical protein
MSDLSEGLVAATIKVLKHGPSMALGSDRFRRELGRER